MPLFALARLAGLSQQQISAIEMGDRDVSWDEAVNQAVNLRRRLHELPNEQQPGEGGMEPPAASNEAGPPPTDRWRTVCLVVALVGCTVLLLRALGRRWWCACGEPFLWSGNIWTPHNSQHLLDPYSFTHVLHGMIFYGLTAWALPRSPLAWRFILALGFEALWEVVENTNLVIERYRAATASLDYLGDTVVNSLGDMASFAAGFALARGAGWRISLAIFIITEAALVLLIKDSLTLNVIMLVWPLDVVRTWQLGG